MYLLGELTIENMDSNTETIGNLHMGIIDV